MTSFFIVTINFLGGTPRGRIICKIKSMQISWVIVVIYPHVLLVPWLIREVEDTSLSLGEAVCGVLADSPAQPDV